MIIFRADGNEIIGSGHIMRCLSIAKATRDAGEACYFVMADSKFVPIIEGAGFPYVSLSTDFSNMREELKVFLSFLEKEKPSCVVVDSYYITEEYLQKIRIHSPIVYIDDLAVSAYPVDALVNYNLYGKKMDYAQLYRSQNRAMPKLLLGPEYAPLRKEFRGLKRKRQPEKIRDILISTGGSDREHVALELMRYITSHESCNQYKYHFLIGAMNPDIPELIRLGEKFPERTELHQNVVQMGQLMQNCDMAVSAAGSTLYELCACGVPTIMYILADNQIPGAQAFCEQNLMLYVGDRRSNKDFAEQVMQAVFRLAEDYQLREQMAERVHTLVTGNGAEKIAKELIAFRTSRG